MAKKKKFGKCYICGCELGEYHLARGSIKLCSFSCHDKFKEQDNG